ncbi:hypothetical protein IHO40_02980 [Wolbachia endosymbiont of Mansonella ozzardi]|uniref:hypothetical protein n=1 Tax=Wolbachia endosymbiont of Mansonella ozzardi TaxID=137464 RepID=UPI001CE1F0B9|nr:hypothetical protein [Wolbachia endosymbiont of Mansonella ozzardi]MCA4775068.1 hypothetical protein [Wolbachia endosymbiont of Mansonella ozzardi]
MGKEKRNKLTKPDVGKEESKAQYDAGIDYCKNSVVREKLLTEVGYSLVDDYQGFDKVNKNQKLKQLFDLIKEKKLTFRKISADNGDGKYRQENNLIKKIFKHGLTSKKAKEADKIIQRKVWGLEGLEQNFNELFKVLGEKTAPDFESQDKKRNRQGFKETSTQDHSKKKEHKYSKLRNFLKSIPVIGKFLAKVFTPEKIEIISNPIYESREAYETYKRSRNKYYSEAKDKAKTICMDGKHEKGVSSKVKQGSVESIEHKKKEKS